MKRIRINNYLPLDTEDQSAKTVTTVNAIHKRFVSEDNESNRTYSLEALQDYVYVESKFTLWAGRYVRYLDMRDAYAIKLKLGGFLVNDNGYTVTLQQNDKTFKVSKRDKLFFMKLTSKDKFRSELNHLLDQDNQDFLDQ